MLRRMSPALAPSVGWWMYSAAVKAANARSWSIRPTETYGSDRLATDCLATHSGPHVAILDLYGFHDVSPLNTGGLRLHPRCSADGDPPGLRLSIITSKFASRRMRPTWISLQSCVRLGQ